jgi:hypothetical protein
MCVHLGGRRLEVVEVVVPLLVEREEDVGLGAPVQAEFGPVCACFVCVLGGGYIER